MIVSFFVASGGRIVDRFIAFPTMGGDSCPYLLAHRYDFPGSTACIDTYALTGWLPESIKLDGSGEAPPVGAVVRNRAEIAAVQGHGNADRIWQRLLSAFNKYGDCLVSISTTALTKEQEERSGMIGEKDVVVIPFGAI